MEAVGYVWGDFAHQRQRSAGSRSPDDAALSGVARAASLFAGRSPDTRQYYPTGTMNNLVYPVAGGMEDWGYAASWEPHHVGSGCRPATYGGYPSEYTRAYLNATARAVVFLVETSNVKSPRAASLGRSALPSAALTTSDADTTAIDDAAPAAALAPAANLSMGPTSEGHVPRNVRFALSAIDLVRPHVQLLFATPNSKEGAFGPRNRLSPTRPQEGCLPVRWRVWGALWADATQLVWTHLDGQSYAARGSATSTSVSQTPSGGLAGAGAMLASHWQPLSRPQSGPALWGQHFEGHGQAGGLQEAGFFSECVHLPQGATRTVHGSPDGIGPHRARVLIAAKATVDQEWSRPSRSVTAPAVGPQSHIVRARTDPSWVHHANGRAVRGQTTFFSNVAVEVEHEGDGRLVWGHGPSRVWLLGADGELLRRAGRALSKASRGAPSGDAQQAGDH